jgi:membrane-associated progesterone receptor component
MGHALSIVLYTALFAVPAYISYRLILGAGTIPSTTRVPAEDTDRELKSVMQPPRTDLEDPKSDPFTLEELREYDGSVPGKPIYVAIKGSCYLIIWLPFCTVRLTDESLPTGTIFDVSRKADVYGPGKSYNIFAGKDGSKGLGMSSLKPEDAVADYKNLDEKETKTLDEWYEFFK